MSREKVQRTNPELWEVCKQEAIENLGKFSARAMQHAVLFYKQRGGGYIGAKSRTNALTKWSDVQENLRKIRTDS